MDTFQEHSPAKFLLSVMLYYVHAEKCKGLLNPQQISIILRFALIFIFRLLPLKASQHLKDFFDSGVDSDI
jgi:hypothetical protein